jgi:hypothetical protein
VGVEYVKFELKETKFVLSSRTLPARFWIADTEYEFTKIFEALNYGNDPLFAALATAYPSNSVLRKLPLHLNASLFDDFKTQLFGQYSDTSLLQDSTGIPSLK